MSSSDLNSAVAVAGSGMKAQAARMKVIAENLANAATTPSSPNERPYQRQVITFRTELDRARGVQTVRAAGVVRDTSPAEKKYDPSHPAADADGYVQTPNVKPVLESMDLRDAQRAYTANISVIEASRVMLMRTIDVIR